MAAPDAASSSSSSPSSSSSSPPVAFALTSLPRRVRRPKSVRMASSRSTTPSPSALTSAARASSASSSSASSSSSPSPSSSSESYSFDLPYSLMTHQYVERLARFLSSPRHTLPIAGALFSLAYFLLFDLRTHVILFCGLVGWLLVVTSGVLAVSRAGGLLAFVSPTTQHMLLDYNLLELIKISWHSRTLQDILSLIIFPLSRAERKRIIERLPNKLSAVLTRRGIIHLLPKRAKTIVGDGRQPTHASAAELGGVSSSDPSLLLVSSSSQPNLAALDHFLGYGGVDSLGVPSTARSRSSRSPFPSHSPLPSPRLSPFAPPRSRSLSALVEAELDAGRESEQGRQEERTGAQGARRRRRNNGAIIGHGVVGGATSVRLPQEKKEFEEDLDNEALTLSDLHNASIASTSSSASSSSASSGSSSSGSSTPDLRDADVRNYEECTPSPAHLYFASRSQQAAFNFQHQQAVAAGTLNGTPAPAGITASSSLAHPSSSSSSSYRAPLSTFLPLPPSIDDLNFSNLLDRQIREHAKEGMKSMARACVDGTKETIIQQWQEAKQYVPSTWLPYLTGQHAKFLVPITSSLVLAQLYCRSPRFRVLMIRAARFGLDCTILAGALTAAVTAYRELTISSSSSSQVQARSSPRGSPQLVSTSARSVTIVSPSAHLPSLPMFQRLHRLPASATVTTLASSWHSLRVFCGWLRLRYRASGTLRTSTLVLMVWFAWLSRNSSIVQAQRTKLVDAVKRLLTRQQSLPA